MDPSPALQKPNPTPKQTMTFLELSEFSFELFHELYKEIILVLF